MKKRQEEKRALCTRIKWRKQANKRRRKKALNLSVFRAYDVTMIGCHILNVYMKTTLTHIPSTVWTEGKKHTYNIFLIKVYASSVFSQLSLNYTIHNTIISTHILFIMVDIRLCIRYISVYIFIYFVRRPYTAISFQRMLTMYAILLWPVKSFFVRFSFVFFCVHYWLRLVSPFRHL